MRTVVDCLLGNLHAYKVDQIGGCMISGLRSEIDEHCALLGCYAAYKGNLVATFRDSLSVGNTYRSHSQLLCNNQEEGNYQN